jgi:hypothetical protein
LANNLKVLHGLFQSAATAEWLCPHAQEVQERDVQQRQNITDLVGVVDKLEGEMKELKARMAKLESAKKVAEQEAADARKANSGLGERCQPPLHEITHGCTDTSHPALCVQSAHHFAHGKAASQVALARL